VCSLLALTAATILADSSLSVADSSFSAPLSATNARAISQSSLASAMVPQRHS
jgi:hypothetical protein